MELKINIYNPNYYKELTDDSAMIQAAIDAAQKDGKTMFIPRRNERTGGDIWNIIKAIKLYSGSVVCLDNCTLRQADGVYENIFVNSNNGMPGGSTYKGRQYDIKVYGRGNALLDGGKPNDLSEKTQKEKGIPVLCNSMFNFVNTQRVHINNLRIINQRYWAIVFHYSSCCRVFDIDFYAPHTVPNQDGIDLRSGCSNFIIENITGCTGDDTVALTALKNRFDKDMLAEGFDDAIHHVIIRNIRSCTPCGIVRLLNHGGKLLYNIIIENITEAAQDDPAHERGSQSKPLDAALDKFRVGACVRIGENYYFEKSGAKAQPDETFNITVRNVVGRARTGIRASCALSNAVFENIQIFGDGGTGVYFGEGNMKNIRVLGIGYPLRHKPRPTDDNRLENYFNQMPDCEPTADRKLCAVYFKETNAENIIFRDIYAGANLTAVFGGNGKVSMKAENIVKENPDTILFDNDLSISKMKTTDF